MCLLARVQARSQAPPPFTVMASSMAIEGMVTVVNARTGTKEEIQIDNDVDKAIEYIRGTGTTTKLYLQWVGTDFSLSGKDLCYMFIKDFKTNDLVMQIHTELTGQYEGDEAAELLLFMACVLAFRGKTGLGSFDMSKDLVDGLCVDGEVVSEGDSKDKKDEKDEKDKGEKRAGGVPMGKIESLEEYKTGTLLLKCQRQMLNRKLNTKKGEVVEETARVRAIERAMCLAARQFDAKYVHKEVQIAANEKKARTAITVIADEARDAVVQLRVKDTELENKDAEIARLRAELAARPAV